MTAYQIIMQPNTVSFNVLESAIDITIVYILIIIYSNNYNIYI